MTSRGQPYKAAAVCERIFLALADLTGGPQVRVWVMAEKRSGTEELLEALVLRMDAMDQAIASLKAQTSSSGVVASSKEDVPQRVGTPSREVIPPSSVEAVGAEDG
ncbi:hypothetical protein NDU88_008709 [Pleurodeles waltl]|uniref:Uncharacterized protein n=1 Tax=Pleurodeles waltl TaxID=8319 RepID=A0AAV7QVB7_PLEWA|nr:hypothetical protein NDU88_008709 [Pleurodeles waltl]